MFNDIEKRLKITGPLTAVIGSLYMALFYFCCKVVTEVDQNGEPVKFFSKSGMMAVAVTCTAVFVIVGILSLWIGIAIEKKKTNAFKWLEKAGKGLRVAAWILGVGGIAAALLYSFWCFFNVVSDVQIVKAISFGIISIVPTVVIAYGIACFFYGLGDAADGGMATYVKDSKLFDMEPLTDKEDTRKICPDCGTRTDKHSCPMCGAKID